MNQAIDYDQGDRVARRLAMATGALTTLAVVVGLALLVRGTFGELSFTTDDAFIYTGYVKMAFTPGAGLFSYNVGEHSAGTTGIAYYLLLVLTYLPLQIFWPAASSPHVLELNSWILAGLCFSATGTLTGYYVWRICQLLDVPGRFLPAVLTAATISLLVFHTEFLWGIVSGMENPLSALLLVALTTLTVTPRFHPGLSGAAAGLLISTRPEWAPIAGCFPLVFLLPGQGRNWRTRFCATAFSYVILIPIVLACFGAMWFYSGQWLPASDGTRVEILWCRPFEAILIDVVKITFGGWGIAVWIAAAAAGWACRRPGLRPLLLVPLFLALFLLMRAILGLTVMNVRDRYISFIWAPLVLASLPAMILLAKETLSRLVESQASRGWLVAGMLGTLASIAGGAWWGSSMILDDTGEMFDIHVAPSQWMAKNLPSGTVVEMEPAGAIRTFTDLVLVDRMGLTTNHAPDFYHRNQGHRTDFTDFLKANQVEYLYDYPTELSRMMKDRDTDLLMRWDARRPMFTHGYIRLLKFRPDAAPRATEPLDGIR